MLDVDKKMPGKVKYGRTTDEMKALFFRRSLFVVKNIEKGEIITEDNVRSIRPFHGMKPKYLKYLLGKRTKVKILRGTPLRITLIEF